MDIFFGNLFWGLLLVLFGLSIIFKGFGLNIPLVKTFIAIIIIMFGVKLLVGGSSFGSWRKREIKTSTTSKHRKEYTMVFASGHQDLRKHLKDIKELEITVVFGSGLIYLPDNIDFDIETTSVFGQTILPKAPSNNGQKIRVDATAVFGRLEFVFKPGEMMVDDPVEIEPEETEGESF